MFNWNAPVRGQGFPMQNPAVPMMSYGAQGQPMALNTAAMPFQPPQWGPQQQQFPQGLGMMPMMGQHPPQWQHMQQFPPGQQPGMFHPPGMRMGMLGGVNPAPPTYPPPEDKPPLPSEPPPPLPSAPHEAKPPLPNEQPKPPLPEDRGMPSNDAPRPPDEPAPQKPAPPARPPSPDPVLLAELEKVKNEEQVFLEQYKQWKKQYDDWREQNQNHPNKDQYEQYLSQWKTYEGQMETRRISIANQKANLEEKIADQAIGKEYLAPVAEEQKEISPNMRGRKEFEAADASKSRHFSGSRRTEWNASVRNESTDIRQDKNSEHHPIEGDDIGEEDMNLDDEEESAGGGIIESSSQPPPHEGWPNRSNTSMSSSHEPKKNWEDDSYDGHLCGEPQFRGRSTGGEARFPGRPPSGEPRFPGGPHGGEPRFPGGPHGGEPRFPGGPPSGGPRFSGGPPSGGPRFSGGPPSGGPRFSGRTPGGEPRFPGGAHGGEPKYEGEQSSEESQFPGGPQDWESSQRDGMGPGGFFRGRGRADRGIMGQGPRFGWRGGGGPRFQGPNNPRRDNFSDYENTEWKNHENNSSNFPDDTCEDGLDEHGYTDQEAWSRETDSESQAHSGFNRGRGFPPIRGRGGFGAFQRGRGSELDSGRGGGFERGRGGPFGRGDPMQGGRGGFPRGGPSFRGRGVQFGGEPNETAPGRGRGSWPVRGRGGPQGPPSHHFDHGMQNNDTEAEDNFDEVERQAQAQYDEDKEFANQETEHFQPGFSVRGRSGMVRGRGRGGFDASFENERNYQEEDSQFNSKDYYESPQTGFGNRGQGLFRGRGGEPFMGRGRGEMNFASDRMSRGFQRGHGAYRGRGGHAPNVQESGEDYDDGYGHVGEEFQDQDQAFPTRLNAPGLRGRGRGRGAAGRPSYGEDTFAAGECNQFDDDTEASSSYHDRFGQAPAMEYGMRPGRGRGGAQFRNSESRWNENDGAYNETEVPLERSAYEKRGPDNIKGPERGEEERDEPSNKRGRFDTDERDQYDRLPLPLPRDDFDTYGDRYPDPYHRYPDSFSRDPYFDPYSPSPYERLPRYDMYGRYDRAVPEKKLFVPAESIDYGHGEADKEKKKAALQQKEVIDYGHGRSSEPKDDTSATTDRESRLPEETGSLGRGRGWDMDDRRDTQGSDQQREYARDDPFRGSQGRFSETYDYSGHERNARSTEFGDSYGSRQSNERLSGPGRRNPDSAFDHDYRNREDEYRNREDLSRGIGRSPSDLSGERRVNPDEPYGRNRDGLYSRDSDDRLKKDDGDASDRDRDDRYSRDPDNRLNRDRDDRYDRDRGNRYDREKADTYGRDRISLNDRDRGDPYSRDREKEDRSRERDRLYNRESGREESPRRRVSDVEEHYGGSGRRGSPYRKGEDRSRSKDFLRGDDYGGSRQTEHSPLRGRRDRDDRADPYSSLGQESVKNIDSFNSSNRWNDRDPYSMASRDQRYGAMPSARDLYGERNMSSPARNSPIVRGPPAPAPLPVEEIKKVEDLLCQPGRQSRPPQLVVIIRGLPGSGKTYVSKLLREKEIKYGGAAPRMLCLDDYFMVEVDKQEVDPDTGKKVKRKVLEYEYEQPLEDAYRQSLLKSFKKTVDDGFFPFIIVDATNEKVVHFSEFWSYAKSRGFQVYVGELNVDVPTCIQRNIHNWTEWDIEKVKSNWEPLPNHYIRLDLRWLLQDDSIDEVEMEDTVSNEDKEKEKEEEEEKDAEADEEDSGFDGIYKKSKWELDSSEKTLDKLDGIPVSKKHIAEHQSMKDYLQLDEPDQLDEDDDYFSRESLPGKKRVRWADLEEKKTQNRRRDLGFIVGQTQRDWDRITDDDFATKALNQTKYFYKN